MFEDGWWCLKLIEDVWWWLKMFDWTWLMMLDMFEVVWEFEAFKILSWWLMRWRECLKKMRSSCLEMVEVGSRLSRCQKKIEDGWECWKLFLRIIQDGFRDAFRDAWRCCLKLEECLKIMKEGSRPFHLWDSPSRHGQTVKPLNIRKNQWRIALPYHPIQGFSNSPSHNDFCLWCFFFTSIYVHRIKHIIP